MLTAILIIIASYLLGSISTAILVCRIMGLPDPRTEGSGNPGATNVLRLGGEIAAAITLAGDVLKGVLPVLVANHFSDSSIVSACAACCAFLGHLFPIFFRFQGGKGVATALGAICTLAWPVGLAMGVTWLLAAGICRYSSLSSITSAVLAPLYAALLHFPIATIVGITVMSGLLIGRHRANIGRLLKGQESRIGQR